MVAIIEKLEGLGRGDENALDASSVSPRKAREEYLTKEITTVFTSGLNDNT